MASVEAVAQPVHGRPAGAWTIAWRRLRRDKVALASAAALVVVIAACFGGAPLAAKLVGHGPDDLFPYAQHDLKPVGPWTRVADTPLLASLEPASPPPKNAGAALLAIGIGVLLGAVAAYFGGFVDSVISRFTDLVMAFPLLLFLVMIGYP